jgi:hypothetical protein
MIRSTSFQIDRVRRLVQAAACVVWLGCQSQGAAPSSDPAAPTSEPERFSFALPSGYTKLELRGEGSEGLRVPAGASLTRTGKGFEVTSGSDFALEIAAEAPALSELGAAGVAPILRESDLLVFAVGAGYSFVVVRELVPEWDESARQRFACGSAGGIVGRGGTRADARAFSKAAVQNMVAACRSLELPTLE